jgi:HD-GYP domain-containing protein (c-di-GMP phosphodiesterase class II)
MASTHRDEISRLELLHAAHPDGLVFPHLADAYRRAGRYSQAEVVLTAGLRRHADYSSAHLVLGRLRLDQGKREEARGAFERVLQLDPQNHVALEYMGELALEEGRLGKALHHFRALQRQRPDADLARRIDELARRVNPASPAGTAEPARESARGGDGGSDGGPERGSDGPVRGATNGGVADLGSPEPDEVVTETIAELYARQGLHERAAAVYRELIDRNPGDHRLKAKLEELRRPGRAEPEPGPREDSDIGIRAYLSSVLSWSAPARPERVERATADAASALGDEPWAAAPVSTPGSIAGPASSGPLTPPGGAAERAPGVRGARAATPSPAAPPSAPPSSGASGASGLGPGPGSAGRWQRLGPPAPKARAPSARPAPQPASPGSVEADPTATLLAVTDLLVGLLEFRDPFFRGSSSLTRLLATSVAEELGLSAEEKVNLALAAILRDLGRVALGGRLVPLGRSTESRDARRRIERHVELALHLLEDISLPVAVREAVRHHHERWDGAGYPDALSEENIPLLARILAVADSFAAMVSPRTYRVPRKAPDAARELQEDAGSHYDPAIVEALVRIVQRRDQAQYGFVQRHHVLLVSPDQPGALVTAAKLCSVGYLAEVAGDVSAARERLRRAPVAALVISAMRPDEGVSDFIRGVRADPVFSTLPIVVVGAEGVSWRVRLLESGADVCFPPDVTHAELQGTLGALVRRTLRGTNGEEAAGDSPWLALQGDVQDFPLTWLLQVMKYDSRTAAIAIRTPREEGAIYLRNGDAIHAQLRGGAKGEAALRAMLHWREGRFTVHPDAKPREETIRSSIMHLLLTQAVDEDHATAGIFGTVSEGS